ncbi:hypothetical protein IFR05_015840 [Cadophora sp. M221]|nr:hypothetical protein IFR05_015840 [Cadophora sp. M221]
MSTSNPLPINNGSYLLPSKPHHQQGDQLSIAGKVTMSSTIPAPPIIFQASDNHLEALKGDKANHTELFHKLLSAVHGEPYKLVSISELGSLTDMADHYCALSALSRSVLPPLLESLFNIQINTVTLIDIAVKLRHEILFREAAVFLAGDWLTNRYEEAIAKLNGRHKKAVVAARSATGLMVADRLQFLLRSRRRSSIVSKQLVRLEQCSDANIVSFFGRIYNGCDEDDKDEEAVKRSLGDLMINNLRLHKPPGSPGEGYYENCFLCSEIADEDLPWDRTQKDF